MPPGRPRRPTPGPTVCCGRGKARLPAVGRRVTRARADRLRDRSSPTPLPVSSPPAARGHGERPRHTGGRGPLAGAHTTGEDPHVAEVAVWVDSYDRPRAAGRPHRRPGPHDGGVPGGGVAVRGLRNHPTLRSTPLERWPTLRPGSSPCRSSTDPLASTTRRGSSAGTQRSRRCQASSNHAVATCATKWCDRSPAGHARDPRRREEAWPSAQHVADPMLFFNAHGDPAVLYRAHHRPCSRA